MHRGNHSVRSTTEFNRKALQLGRCRIPLRSSGNRAGWREVQRSVPAIVPLRTSCTFPPPIGKVPRRTSSAIHSVAIPLRCKSDLQCGRLPVALGRHRCSQPKNQTLYRARIARLWRCRAPSIGPLPKSANLRSTATLSNTHEPYSPATDETAATVDPRRRDLAVCAGAAGRRSTAEGGNRRCSGSEGGVPAAGHQGAHVRRQLRRRLSLDRLAVLVSRKLAERVESAVY